MRLPTLRLPLRIVLLPLLAVASAGCDAGNRTAPGSDNTLGAPTVAVSTPYEGQEVVRARQAAPVLAKIDVTGLLGRGAGSTLRYRLERGMAGAAAVVVVTEWTALSDASLAVALGDLKANAADERYTLTVEVLDAKGAPWTRVEGEGAAARTHNPQSTCVRTFRVADAWQ